MVELVADYKASLIKPLLSLLLKYFSSGLTGETRLFLILGTLFSAWDSISLCFSTWGSISIPSRQACWRSLWLVERPSDPSGYDGSKLIAKLEIKDGREVH